MQFLRTERFKKDFRHLPLTIQDKLPEILERFVTNRRPPSLHLKKMEGTRDIWEMRVSDNYRITFQWVEGGILLRRIGTHNILQHP